MAWQTALVGLFIVLAIVTNGYIMQTRLDKIIDLLNRILHLKEIGGK